MELHCISVCTGAQLLRVQILWRGNDRVSTHCGCSPRVNKHSGHPEETLPRDTETVWSNFYHTRGL